MKRYCVALFFVALLNACSTDSPVESQASTPSNEVAPISKGDLFRAVARGERDRVSELLSRGADVNENVSTNKEEVTPLLAAIANGDEDIARILVLNGASVRASFKGYTPNDFANLRFGGRNPLVDLIQEKGKK